MAKNEIIHIKQEAISGMEEEVCDQISERQTWSSTHAFTLLRINDDNFLPYYIIRCKRRDMSTAISKLRRHRHPYSQVLFQQSKVPNAINLFERMKQHNIIKAKRNYCIPVDTNGDETKFINHIRNLCGTKNPQRNNTTALNSHINSLRAPPPPPPSTSS